MTVRAASYALVGLLAACAAAQTPSEPPPLIRVIRNQIRPGAEEDWIRPYADARTTVNVLGMNSVSGISETWLMELHDSFASIEDTDRALSAIRPAPRDETLAPSRTMIALYRPGPSYRPEEAIKLLPKARYLQVSIYRIRPGTEDGFAELVRQNRLSLDAINLEKPDIVYQVVSGAPSGTYIFLAPLASLRIFDSGIARAPAYAEPAIESGRKARDKIAADVELGSERLLLRIEPRISYVSDQFAAADREFWNPGTKPRN